MTSAVDRRTTRPAWFVGAAWGSTDDQTERFLRDGIWENGWEENHYSADLVRLIQPGDRIAIKARYGRQHDLPFDNRGKYVPGMLIKAVGVVKQNMGDGRIVRVEWTPVDPPRAWYFSMYAQTIHAVRSGNWKTDALTAFAFNNEPQDYDRFRNDPQYTDRFGDREYLHLESVPDQVPRTVPTGQVPYAIENILAEGCFLDQPTLETMLQRLTSKQNLILQGPPGTGKTWLAKKLAYALIGRKDESKVRPMQFHPNLSYEDFVRGWRPQGNGQLALVDGPFLQVVEDARNDRDNDYVMVIEEINRGNPASVFGEMLTLLEADKRNADEALALAYPREIGERVHIPRSVYVIGTMNLADRSLAMVDLALRRRFAFFDLEPMLNETWRDWVHTECGVPSDFLEDIARRIDSLNGEIAGDRSLGRQFRIGHSFVTPAAGASIGDPQEWFTQVVETEIVPLLHEYWFDDPDRVADARSKLSNAL